MRRHGCTVVLHLLLLFLSSLRLLILHCMAGGGSIRVQWADGGSGYFFTASDVSFINNTVVGVFDSSIPTGATTLDTGGAAVVVSGRVNDSVVQVNGCIIANNTLRIVGLPRTDNAAALGALAVVVGNVWSAPVVGGTHIAVWDTVIAGNAVLAPNGTSAEGGQVGLLFGCTPRPLLCFKATTDKGSSAPCASLRDAACERAWQPLLPLLGLSCWFAGLNAFVRALL